MNRYDLAHTRYEFQINGELVPDIVPTKKDEALRIAQEITDEGDSVVVYDRFREYAQIFPEKGTRFAV